MESPCLIPLDKKIGSKGAPLNKIKVETNETCTTHNKIYKVLWEVYPQNHILDETPF